MIYTLFHMLCMLTGTTSKEMLSVDAEKAFDQL